MTKITIITFVVMAALSSCIKQSRTDTEHLTFRSATEALKAVDVQGFRTANRTSTPPGTFSPLVVNPSVAQSAANTAIYVKQKYQLDLSAYNANTLAILGLYLAANESDPTEHTMHCFVTAVASLIGLTEAGNIWNSLAHGVVGAETVIGAVKLIAKRVGTVITVAFAVYEAGECLGFWKP